MSKYDSIKTAADLVSEVKLHGLSTDQEDICRAQDIFGNTPIVELAALANDIGQNNHYSTQGTFYMIVSHIWNWEEVTRFWNQYTNPQTEELEELKSSYIVLKKEEVRKSEAAAKEHDLRLAETSEKLKLKEEVEKLRAELHDRNMDVMELKAKLYDLLVERKEVV